jgi:beta-glucanase (GH16 family)
MSSIVQRWLKKGILIVVLSISQASLSYAGWEVSWIDKFDGTAIDMDNWTPQIDANFNDEKQCYTDDETSPQRNFEMSDGTLKIIARKQTLNCPGLGGQIRDWTSGRLNSKDKGEFLYGRIEARIRFSNLEGGTWPAFWMLENRIGQSPIKGDNDTINWPNPGAGEIDVWEWFSNDGDSYITNFFNAGNCGSLGIVPYPGKAPDVKSFHTYAMEWTADNIKFFFNDDVVSQTDISNCAQYKEPMFILLNVAMGGLLGGDIDPQLTEATMEIDYVAHCTPSNLNESTQCNESTPTQSDQDNDGVKDDLDLCPNTLAGTVVANNGCEFLTQPETGAPIPQELSQQVISIFSDSYNNIDNVNLDPFWDQSTVVTEVEIAGNNTLRYGSLNYQGTDLDRNRQDVSDMDMVHLDYWTNNATALSFFLISPGPKETPYVIDVKLQEWTSLSIPLSVFTDVDLTEIFQFKMTGSGNVYLDNIYFSKNAVIVTDADGDGVLDADDLCANTAVGVQVDNTGCAIEVNVAPTVTLTATQAGANITRVITDAGNVVIQATVVDDNQADTHTYSWTPTGVSTFVDNGDSISFDPSGLDVTQIAITVIATDNAQPSLSGEGIISLSVTRPTVEPGPAPSGSGGGTVNLLMLLSLLLLSSIRLVSTGIRV